VFLPGAQEVPGDIVRQGFVRRVRERALAVDVIVADAHVGYFRQRVVLERLHADVIAPARTRGYDAVWLAGISLGGLGALLYAADADGVARPRIDGVLAIAPFLAARDVIDEVIDAGGLRHWRPPPSLTERRFLAAPAGLAAGLWPARVAAARLVPRLRHGRRLRAKNRMLGDLLPRDRLFVAPGGHTWAPWLQIWDAMLDRAPLPRIV
jgi:alpha-beta hydrolase superfamily lysophospholipase